MNCASDGERRATAEGTGRLVEIPDDVRKLLKRLDFIIEESSCVPYIGDGLLLNIVPL
jgi:hypothetical protein